MPGSWRRVGIAVVPLLLLAAPVRAQGFVAVTVGAASGGLVTKTAPTYGGEIGSFGSFFGVEGDYGYSANVGPATTAPAGLAVNLNIRTASGDLLLGPRVGSKGRWHPYGAIGVGLLGGVSQLADVFHTKGNDITLNAGGGVMGLFTNHLGIRFDVRYFRDLVEAHDVPNAKASFIRVGAGVVLRF